MRFSVRRMDYADAQAISGWRYAAPYDVYAEDLPKEPPELYRALVDMDGTLCGFFCWGEAAQTAAGADLVKAHSDWLDFGIGLRPDLTGKGMGLWACQAALGWLRGRFHPPAFRLSVYDWNERAQRVYGRLGFVPLTVRGDFLVMVRDERPWLDATRPLENGMPVYYADPGFDRHLHYHKENCGYDMSVFFMTAHTGTHVDAPAHLGMPGDTESLPLDRLNGVVYVAAWPMPEDTLPQSPRMLFKTGGRGLTLAEAQGLVEAGVDLIGLDAMSAGEGEEEYAVHKLLLERGVLIVENIALEAFDPGWYDMRCLPLRMPGSDGAPVRLQLRKALL